MSEFFASLLEPISGIFNTLTPWDFFDVVIVAYLLYKLIKFVRETRAGQLVKGILILLIAYLVASLGLRTVQFVLNEVFKIGILAIIIVFQPELRRALEKVGRAKVAGFGAFTGSLDPESLEAITTRAIGEICTATASMSKQKVGALIVLEGKTRLGEIINTGTMINSEISALLIENVFFHNAPLHDGAMIIRNGRIVSAGCFLPLSNNMEIGKELGTRHRAALGMSENSDALIIVVSEETGVVSLTKNGVIKRNYTLEMLRISLEEHLLDKKPDTSENKLFRKGKKVEKTKTNE